MLLISSLVKLSTLLINKQSWRWKIISILQFIELDSQNISTIKYSAIFQFEIFLISKQTTDIFHFIILPHLLFIYFVLTLLAVYILTDTRFNAELFREIDFCPIFNGSQFWSLDKIPPLSPNLSGNNFYTY